MKLQELADVYNCISNRKQDDTVVLNTFLACLFQLQVIVEVMADKKIRELSSEKKFVYLERVGATLVRLYIFAEDFESMRMQNKNARLEEFFDRFSSVVSNVIAVCDQAGIGEREDQELTNLANLQAIELDFKEYLI